MAKTEKEMLENYKARIKKQNEKIKEDYDRVSATLPKGTIDRIKSLGLTINRVINESVLAYLDCMEEEQEQPKEPQKAHREPTLEELQELQELFDQKKAEQDRKAEEQQNRKEEQEQQEKEERKAELLEHLERIRNGEQIPEDEEKEKLRQESITRSALPY